MNEAVKDIIEVATKHRAKYEERMDTLTDWNSRVIEGLNTRIAIECPVKVGSTVKKTGPFYASYAGDSFVVDEIKVIMGKYSPEPYILVKGVRLKADGTPGKLKMSTDLKHCELIK